MQIVIVATEKKSLFLITAFSFLAAAELDLLGDDDQEIRDGDIRSHQLQEESEVAQASNEGVSTSQGEMEPVAQLNRGSLR